MPGSSETLFPLAPNKISITQQRVIFFKMQLPRIAVFISKMCVTNQHIDWYNRYMDNHENILQFNFLYSKSDIIIANFTQDLKSTNLDKSLKKSTLNASVETLENKVFFTVNKQPLFNYNIRISLLALESPSR